jgi:DNA-binding response OmpR family regulator
MQYFYSRVLVLEDNKNLRQTVMEMLSRQGLAADAASDGFTALKMLDADEFDLIVAEVRLPGGISGLDTVRDARARHPRLRSLFISGGRGPPMVNDPRSDDFVSKPFDSRELLGCVWALLTRDLSQEHMPGSARAAEKGVRAAKVACLNDPLDVSTDNLLTMFGDRNPKFGHLDPAGWRVDRWRKIRLTPSEGALAPRLPNSPSGSLESNTERAKEGFPAKVE